MSNTCAPHFSSEGHEYLVVTDTEGGVEMKVKFPLSTATHIVQGDTVACKVLKIEAEVLDRYSTMHYLAKLHATRRFVVQKYIGDSEYTFCFQFQMAFCKAGEGSAAVLPKPEQTVLIKEGDDIQAQFVSCKYENFPSSLPLTKGT